MNQWPKANNACHQISRVLTQRVLFLSQQGQLRLEFYSAVQQALTTPSRGQTVPFLANAFFTRQLGRLFFRCQRGHYNFHHCWLLQLGFAGFQQLVDSLHTLTLLLPLATR